MGSSSDVRVTATPSQPAIVTILGYSMLAASLFATWRLASAPAVVLVALMATALTIVLCADFSLFRASGGGFSFEAQRKVRRAVKELQEVVEQTA